MQVRLCCPVFLVLVILAGSLASAGAQVLSMASADRDALAALVQELDAAWNARDAVRFSAVFAEDGSFQFPVEGLALRGREDIGRHYAQQFASLPPELRHVTTTRESDVIGPGLVAVDFEVEILGTDPNTGAAQTPIAHYRGLGIGVHSDSGWHIRVARVYSVPK